MAWLIKRAQYQGRDDLAGREETYPAGPSFVTREWTYREALSYLDSLEDTVRRELALEGRGHVQRVSFNVFTVSIDGEIIESRAMIEG